MGYLTKHESLGAITDVAAAAKSVVEDPCLGQVTAMLLHLRDLEQRAPALVKRVTPTKPTKPTAPVKGIGLCKAVPPLRAVVWVRERPWVASLAALSVVGGLVGAGYLLGKRRR